MLNQIKTIMAILRYLPEAFKLVKQFLSLVKNAIDESQRKKLNEKFEQALEQAKETKDTSNIEDLFAGNKKQEIKLIEVKKEVIVPKQVLKPVNNFDIKFKRVIEIDAQKGFEISGFKSMGFGSPSNSVIADGSKPQVTGFGLNNKMSSKWIVSIALIVISSFIGCKGSDIEPPKGENRPDYKPKIWAASSKDGGLVRSQSNEFIDAKDARFDDYFAMDSSTLACVYKTYINNCKEFKHKVIECDGVDAQKVQEAILKMEL